nr:second-largest subunit of RNA polymerase III [Cryptomonas curvata]
MPVLYKYFDSVGNYFKSKHFLWQQIESFNCFLLTDLKKIIYKPAFVDINKKKTFIYKFNTLNIGATTTLDRSIEYSTTPQECRIRDLSYIAPVFINVHYQIDNKIFSRFNLVLCNIPIMIHSKKCVFYNRIENFFYKNKECSLDPGGYFIIKGTERIILIQENLCTNRITIEKDKGGNICAVIVSCLFEKKTKNWIVLKDKKFYFRNSIFLEDISILIIFKALGFTEEKDLIEIIGTEFEEMLEFTIYDSKMTGIITQKQAILYLYQKLDSNIWKYKNFLDKKFLDSYDSVKEFIFNIFSNYILIHVISTKEYNKLLDDKIIFISIMIRRILISLDQPLFLDSKDYYGNKRLELSGQLVSILFEDLFKKTIFDMEKKFSIINKNSKKYVNQELFSFFRSDLISNGLEYSFSTGNWSVKKFTQERYGVTQVLSRLSFISSISMINRIISTCEKTRKASGPRSLHPSQWGMLCPSDTPEGESCGLVKNLAIFAHITTNENTKHVLILCFDLGVEPFIFYNKEKKFGYFFFDLVFLNGNCIGIHHEASKFLFTFRKIRRKGMISPNISIFWDTIARSVMIWTDSGRVCRPLFVVEFGKCKINYLHRKSIKNGLFFWKKLQREGLVELLDTNEQNNALIATNLEYIELKTTHMEISPEIIIGICSSIIPFPDHNQSPRNTYQCAMGKQAIGSLSFNQNQRNDTVLSLLWYSQKPMVKTKMIEISGNGRLTGGCNACVCIMSYSGYDIEDAVILNRSSIERGFFRSTLFKKTKFMLKNRKNNINEIIVNKNKISSLISKDLVDQKKKLKADNNENLEKNYPITDSFFEQDFFLSWCYKEYEDGIIHNVILTSNYHDLVFIKLITRQTRIPEIGDKFSSRHGQKGICGLINSEGNLPFSSEGNIPDLIMNPHGFPSRMTIGKMIELIGSKISSLLGKFFDGTPFKKFDIKLAQKKLTTLGFSKNCKDFFFSGETGYPLQMFVFSGPVFYQKLKHMVRDKMHARGRGPRSGLTRQPIEGRSKGGGLRFGEMERDCLISYGASELTVERLMISSDVFLTNFDKKTGLITHNNSKNNIISVKFPYACKLLFQELHAMNIIPRICVDRINFIK